MKTVLQHPTDSHHYEAEICLVWCFDDRFSPLLDALIKQENWKYLDLIKVAGGAKGLAGEAGETDRVFFWIK